ncbi:MAG: branched-chain amino acid ABC transporter substrate-binding protein [Deltaproteobacteria bacterium]|nr:branched-chain amino acid ABC transporter substrate-binding protein [Deltaproteobacteria bacterium]MBW1934359.1 branched-chain amino acid ABC transporter substrate-binding protein [Deltaproteobacteria bacterium]MBW1978463.1 branched-chain amino acid ABC transporter substrate-binding protein [Deltaproteobacteria bacterium]MBW2043457.1 branched-chain amino acid ABC transporter substrate-binding protein [Deltaproteobacteria bacterium]MBW2299423.1 branched-chain amino acid ABC transporter substr
MKKVLLLGLSVCLIIAFSTINGYAADVSKGLSIGAAGPFTGPAAAPGMEIFNSIKIAVDEKNAAGGIKGVKVKLVMGDDAGDAAQGVNVAEKFCADKTMYGVIGPPMSNVAEATLRMYAQCNLTCITTAASRPDLTEKGYHHFFRVNARDDAHGPAVGHFIAEDLKAKSVYVLNTKDTYSQGYADQVVATLKKLGVKKIWRDTIVASAKDYSSVLTRVKAKNPDVLVVGAKTAPDHAVMVRQMRELGIKAIYFGSEGAKDKKDFIQASEGAAEGAYLNHFAPDIYKIPEAAHYVKVYESKYGSLSGFGPPAYDATNILLNAMEKAAADGDITRKEVMKYMAQTKNYRGILGFPITFDKKGDLLGGATYIFKVVGGDFKLVKVAKGM